MANDDEIDAVKRRLDALEEENAELRERLTAQKGGFSRRGVLGAIAGGSLLAGVGTASAADTEAAVYQQDDQDQGDENGRKPYRTVGVRETDSIRIEDRQIYSTEAQSFYIDPDEGSDDNDGSEDAPFRTLQRASREMALFQLHQFEIHLARENPENKYDAAHFPPSVLGYDAQNVDGGSGKKFAIFGDRDNPSAYPFERDSKLGIGFAWNVDVPNAWVAGVELGGVNLDGTCTFIDCNLTGWEPTSTCVTGYTGRGQFRNCTFTSDAKYAFAADDGKIIMARNSTIETEYVHSRARYGKVDLGGFLFLDEDPGVPFFESEQDARDVNVYIQVDGAVLNGPGTLHPGAES